MITIYNQLNELRDFFNCGLPLIYKKNTLEVDKQATILYSNTMLEYTIQFFNENSAEEYDLRDQKRCALRCAELMNEIEEEGSDCCSATILDNGLCSYCKEYA